MVRAGPARPHRVDRRGERPALRPFLQFVLGSRIAVATALSMRGRQYRSTKPAGSPRNRRRDRSPPAPPRRRRPRFAALRARRIAPRSRQCAAIGRGRARRLPRRRSRRRPARLRRTDELALVGVRDRRQQHVGNGDAEHPVAEKLEPLVAVATGTSPTPGALAWVSARLDQPMVGEAVAECLQWRAARRRPPPGRSPAPSGPPFRRAVPSPPPSRRTPLPRTGATWRDASGADGHFQMRFERASSAALAIEKKMMLARPTRFSNGTKPTWSKRLSVELSRLSPIMKKWPGGTTNSRVSSPSRSGQVERVVGDAVRQRLAIDATGRSRPR
jgi:hypothetical protein